MCSLSEVVKTPQTAPYQAIAVSNVQRGRGSVIATCDLKLGGLFIRGVTLRQGRKNNVFLNFPSRKNEHGRWVPWIEIVSPALEAFVRQAVDRAVSEVSHE